MRKSKFTETQIFGILREAVAGAAVADVVCPPNPDPARLTKQRYD
jgi:hypothetical protein